MALVSTTSPSSTEKGEQQGAQLAPEPDHSAHDATNSAPPLMLATDACCQFGHVTAEVERGGGEAPILVCFTCAGWWGYREGLRGWAERCPDSFSEVNPNGLADLDDAITARPIA